MRRISLIFYLFALMLMFSQCASTGFLVAKAKVNLFGEKYQPKGVGEKIDIFITNKPDQDYTEFALITCKDTNDKWSLDQILKKAGEIGADAVIIIGKASSGGVGIPIGYSTYVVSEAYGMTAVAIKYK
jgi:hypothetical protein